MPAGGRPGWTVSRCFAGDALGVCLETLSVSAWRRSRCLLGDALGVCLETLSVSASQTPVAIAVPQAGLPTCRYRRPASGTTDLSLSPSRKRDYRPVAIAVPQAGLMIWRRIAFPPRECWGQAPLSEYRRQTRDSRPDRQGTLSLSRHRSGHQEEDGPGYRTGESVRVRTWPLWMPRCPARAPADPRAR